MPHLSVVIPVYGCADCLPQLCERLRSALTPLSTDFEIVLVDDASPDDAWPVIEALGAADPRIKGLQLSRNFGQHVAISAGLDHCEGDWVVVMDCDLQDSPEVIPDLYARAQQGFDIVFARRRAHRGPVLRRLSSWLFLRLMSLFLGFEVVANSNFSICSRQVIANYRRFSERERSYTQFLVWMGFRSSILEFDHGQRAAGRSAYTLGKLLSFAITSVVTYSNRPLTQSVVMGLVMAFGALSATVWLILRGLLFQVTAEGWTSIMVAIFFVGGLLLVNIGVLGLYLGKTYNQVRQRPLYIVREQRNVAALSAPAPLPPGRELT